jgi:hypothetical protein
MRSVLQAGKFRLTLCMSALELHTTRPTHFFLLRFVLITSLSVLFIDSVYY